MRFDTPEPKRMRTFPGVGHDDLVVLAGAAVAEEIASWASGPTEAGRNVPLVSRAHVRVLALLAALTVGFALPAGAVAQSQQLPGLSEEPPPLPGGEDPDGPETGGEDEPDGGEGEPGEGGGDPGEGGGDSTGPADGADGPVADELPRTGSEPLLLGLSGAALALLGTGLRLRTLDADLF